ncbi:putative Syn8 snare [Aureobasidium pullulans]|nr:putative Syn8 snare [Aureobasidium pullulans]
MSTSPHQLFLLADHIKLSLLERQRALSLKLPGNNTNEGPITRSLESLRSGIETLSAQAEEDGADLSELQRLKKQYEELNMQFQGYTSTTATTTPNDNALAPDFAAAKQTTTAQRSKSVRFDKPYRDSSPPDANRGKLFNNATAGQGQGLEEAYKDDPSPPDHTDLSNEQIHAYHKNVLGEQDAQLDTLSQSIGRQRMLGIQMGDEMDDQNAMLDDVERGVDRFQGNLDRARGRLGKVARKAKDNWSWVTIGVLILILVLLLVILN